VFRLAQVARHELVLDLHAATGLLTWEAVRRAPVGGVYALAHDEATAQALRQQSQNLESLVRPVIVLGSPMTADLLPDISFEVIVGRNVLTHMADKAAVIQDIAKWLKSAGRLVLAESVPRQTQRLHQLVDLATLPSDLVTRWVAAEEAIYQQAADPMVNWTGADLAAMFTAAGLSAVELLSETMTAERQISPEQIQRWFALTEAGARPTWAQHLFMGGLTHEEVAQVRALFERQLSGQVVAWATTVVYVVGVRN
jgi:putative ATPase